MFNSVIMGFGLCGKNLHLRCLRKLQTTELHCVLSPVVDVCDPNVVPDTDGTGLRHHHELPPAAQFASPILHICTPPTLHLESLREALKKGYRKIILEKPMAPSTDDAREISLLVKAYCAEVLVVAVWLNSTLTASLLCDIAPGDFSAIEVLHNKARFSRTLQRKDEHIFDIEIPHQLSLVLPLIGPQVNLLSAVTLDMSVHGEIRPTMGRGEIVLQGLQGGIVRLISNLDYPVRERSITVHMHNGEKWVGNYPVSGDDSYSQLFKYSRQNILIAHEVFEDDPLTACLRNYYTWWSRAGELLPMPAGADLDFNLRVVTLIDQAKKRCHNVTICSNFEELRHIEPGALVA